MAELAVRTGHAHALLGPEDLHVEVDRVRGAVHVQVGRDARVALGDRVHVGHVVPPFVVMRLVAVADRSARP